MSKRRNRRKEKWDEGGHWEEFPTAMVRSKYSGYAGFPRFWIDTNDGWGTVSNERELRSFIRHIAQAWKLPPKDAVLRLQGARRNPSRELDTVPHFGLYSEYTGRETLGAFLERHGITFPKL